MLVIFTCFLSFYPEIIKKHKQNQTVRLSNDTIATTNKISRVVLVYNCADILKIRIEVDRNVPLNFPDFSLMQRPLMHSYQFFK